MERIRNIFWFLWTVVFGGTLIYLFVLLIDVTNEPDKLERIESLRRLGNVVGLIGLWAVGFFILIEAVFALLNWLDKIKNRKW